MMVKNKNINISVYITQNIYFKQNKMFNFNRKYNDDNIFI